MGDGYSNPVVGAGGDLIRAAIRSLGFKTGLLGWIIRQDGTAEFLDILIRGTFSTGSSGQRVVIYDINGPAGAGIDIFPALPVVSPFRMSTSDFLGMIFATLAGPDTGFGHSGISFQNSDAGERPTLHLFGSMAPTNVAIDGGLLVAQMTHQMYQGVGTVTTTSTSYVTHANGPGGTFNYPPSGVVTVMATADCENSLNNFANAIIRIRDTDSAGAIRYTGSYSRILHQGVSGRENIALVDVATGLPTSGVAYVEMLFLSSAGANTATFRNTLIVVQPSP